MGWGLKGLVAFWGNDPFYPRTGGEETADEELWGVFKTRFLLKSQEILEEDDVWLAERLVRRVEEEGVLRRKGKKRLD